MKHTVYTQGLEPIITVQQTFTIFDNTTILLTTVFLDTRLTKC